MNKLELISALKTKADISKSEAAKVVQIFFDSMADAMADENASKFAVCAASLSKSTKAIREETPKPAKRSPLNPRSFLFSRPEKSSRNG